MQYADPAGDDPAVNADADRAKPGSRPLDAGRLLIGLGALALLISLFLDWYGDEASESAISAWTSFELVDLLLAALALAALYAVVVGIAAPDRAPRLPSPLLALAGPVVLIVVLASIIDEPPLVGALDPTIEAGAWIALAAALAMTVGAVLSNLRISLVIGPREPAARPVDPAAETQSMRTEPEAGAPADPPDRRHY